MGLSTLRPEERVRQNFIIYLEQLGFPTGYIIQEKALSELPHLSLQGAVPNRRIDILAYGLIGGVLKPLVLVECKYKILDEKALFQVMGYNHYVGALRIALVSEAGYLLYNVKTKVWEKSFASYATICSQA